MRGGDGRNKTKLGIKYPWFLGEINLFSWKPKSLFKAREKKVKNTVTIFKTFLLKNQFKTDLAAALAQWVRAFAPQAEGWVFESQPPQT